MELPLHRVNVLTGIKGAKIINDPKEYSRIIKKSKRPLFVFGPRLLELSLNGKLLVEYAIEISKAINAPICATSHIRGKMVELERVPESTYDLVEIINHLKDPDWKGVKKEGNHDLIVFFGMRTDLGEQGLSTLKHFAPHLRTMTLCKYFYPNADYSLPNFRKDEEWKHFLEDLIEDLKKKEE